MEIQLAASTLHRVGSQRQRQSFGETGVVLVVVDVVKLMKLIGALSDQYHVNHLIALGDIVVCLLEYG